MFIDTLIWFIFFALNPLLFKGEIINVYELPKLLLLAITATIFFGIYIFKKGNGVDKYFWLFFIGFLVLSFINLSVSINSRRSFLGNKMLSDSIVALVLYFLFAFALLISRIKKERLVDLGVLMGTSLAIVSILHFLALTYGLTHISYDGRITATIGQPNVLGGILVGLIPLAWYKLVRNFDRVGKNENGGDKSMFWVFVGALQLLLITTAMLLTFSRGAYIALMLVVSIEIFYILKKRQYKIIYVSLITIMITGIVLFPPIDSSKIPGPYLVKRFFSFKDQSKIQDSRIEIWQNTLPIVVKRPVFGFGNSTFQQDYEKYLDISKAPHTKFQEVESSHNIILDILVEWGIIGFVFFLGGVILLLLNSTNRYFKYIIIAILARSLFNVTATTIFVVLFFGVALLLKEESENAGKLSKSQSLLYKKYIQHNDILKFVYKLRHRLGALVLFVLSLSIFFIYSSIYKSEQYEFRAMHEGDPNKVISDYKKAIKYNPMKQDLYIKLVSIIMWKSDYETAKKYAIISAFKFNDSKSNYYLARILRSQNTEESIKYYEKSKSLSSKNPNIRHELAILYYETGDYDKAYENFLDVVKINKKDFSDDYIYLAEIDYRRGDIDNAIKYATLAAPSWRRGQLARKLGIKVDEE